MGLRNRNRQHQCGKSRQQLAKQYTSLLAFRVAEQLESHPGSKRYNRD
jgi:hypothetical protein